VPFLQAEEDRRFHRAWKERTAMEDKIMEGVDGWKSGENVYSSTWMPPHNTLTPRII
jgi:NADH dehydrogenase (ubiquinone) 1 alpha subcomplex subunit 13